MHLESVTFDKISSNYQTLSPTYFQGHGYHCSIEGLQVANDPWNNISSQGFQVY